MVNTSINNLFPTSPSKYFKHFDYGKRQDMMENLLIGAIKQNGINFKYIPKENFVRDNLWGDDLYSKYEDAITLEGYVKNIANFDGQQDIFNMNGFQIADQITITISKKRWFEVQTDEFAPDDASDYRTQPQAGDLIWLSVMNKVFEITHSERVPSASFFQFGKLMTFELTCELYKYNSDNFETGFDQVDVLDDMFNRDTNRDDLTTESGIVLTNENGEPLISEEYQVEIPDPQANNSLYQEQADEVINYNEKSPFTKDRW